MKRPELFELRDGCAFVRLVDDESLTLDEIRKFLLDQGVAPAMNCCPT